MVASSTSVMRLWFGAIELDKFKWHIAGMLSMVLVCTFCVKTDYVKAQNVSTISIGVLVSYNTVIGRSASKAIQIAVDDINNDDTLLDGSTLVVQMLDTNCSAFQGAMAATQLLEKEVIAVIGPQSTAVSHFVAHMGTAAQVPLISFAVTDPALSEFLYSYFFRIAHTDAVQMQAIASFIDSNGWIEVAVLYTDDDFGTNGAASLSDALRLLGARVAQRAAVVPDMNNSVISRILVDLDAMQTRVFVVHMPQSLSLRLFHEANYLGMMTNGYAWIVSDSTLGTLDSTQVNTSVFDTLQGVVGFRGYYSSASSQFQAFLSKWNNFSSSAETQGEIHVYGLYAYDATWMLAYAADKYLKDGFNFTFQYPVSVQDGSGSSTELAKLKVFEGGQSLRKHLLQTEFMGASGYVKVNSKGDLIRTAFEIVNVVGGKLDVVGYWTNETNLSVLPPGNVRDGTVEFSDTSSPLQILWPGNTTQTPKVWVSPQNRNPLKIAVPKKSGFNQFISWSSTQSNNATSFRGFCIDVFVDALKYLPYSVPYTFVLYGNDSTPDYDDMIDLLADKVYDAVVGDVTITTKRMENVDFTQPYTESGLVVVVPIENSHSNYAWAFLRPFTRAMWFTILAFLLFTGVVIWMLEHKKNSAFRGHPRKQIVTILWFTFSTLFSSQREKIRSTFGRLVVIIWLFVILIITSSYKANLTSILTVQELTPSIQGISSLQDSNGPIGYQTGSFVRDYLISLNIAEERLKPLPSVSSYAEALTLGPNNGGVAAIVDELPYLQVFLDAQCGFTIAGQVFTKSGWGFAFPKDSELAIDTSTAILEMSENGELQNIHDLWLLASNCSTNNDQADSNQLDLNSFWGLFLITGSASALSLIIYLVRLLCQFPRKHNDTINSNRSFTSRSKKLITSFVNYVDDPGVRMPANKKQCIESGKRLRNTPYPSGQSCISDQSSSSKHGLELKVSYEHTEC